MSYPPTIMADTGCAHAHAAVGHPVRCVECPFTACLHDVPAQQVRSRERAAEAKALFQQGLSAVEAAQVLGVGRRQATRYRSVDHALG